MTEAEEEIDVFEPSFRDKLAKAFYLGLALAYVGDTCVEVRDMDALFGAEVSDRIWVWVDGLVQNYHVSRMTGRCSLQATIDYDIGEAEASIDKEIALFQGLVRQHGIECHTDLLI